MGIVTFARSLCTAPPWQPTDIAGLALWIKGSTVLYDGSNYIYSAPDGSGNSNDASQGTAVNQPLFVHNALNTHAVMRFDGSSDFMTGTTIANLGIYCLDIFIVAKGASTMGSDWGMLFGVGNYGNGLWIGRHSGLQALAVYNNGTLIYTSGNLPNTGFGYKIFELWKNSGVSAKILYNNILQASGNLGNFTNANYYLGYGGLPYQQYFAGDEAEILIYVTPTALGDSDRALIGKYLQNEYALPFIVNKIPTMTSDTSPSGIVTYGHSAQGFLGWLAFDGDDTTYWNAGVNPNTFLCYQLPIAKIFTAYYIKSFIVGPYNSYSPTAWTIQASNNGIDWTVIDTQTGQSCQYGNFYLINNTLPFLYYKIVITAAQYNNPTIQTLMFS